MLYQSLTDRLNNQHSVIQLFIDKLNDEQLKQQPEPGKWSIHDQIAHLAKYQLLFIDRIDLLVAVDEPEFERYDANEDTSFAIYQNLATTELLALINKERAVIIQNINGLSSGQLTRTARHPKYGNLTALEWTEFFLLHEAHHLFAIFQLAHTF
ncbi:DinB family protein [Mucilaginibacter sp.]|uniref:DinB family protein n=1 Tax=Mucilaginibacter sp. TaxID=1882438 RepID=UPI003D11496B